jgi:hypothetical protein
MIFINSEGNCVRAAVIVVAIEVVVVVVVVVAAAPLKHTLQFKQLLSLMVLKY